jgi:nucleotide-binding universal stress UspA family protein
LCQCFLNLYLFYILKLRHLYNFDYFRYNDLTLSLSKTQKNDEALQIVGDIQLKKILVPIDGSRYSMKAAKYAIEVAKLQKAQIVCIYVIAKLSYGYEYAGSLFDEYFEDIKNKSQSWFNQINKMAENDGLKNIETDILINVLSITDAIISYASNNSTDLIVIGTKGRTGIDRFLLGSVASGVVKHSHCPVFIVR